MSKNEERERARLMAILPDPGDVAVEIFAAASTFGDPGSPIPPELAELASQVAGAEAAGRWLRAGRTPDDCAMVRRFYEHVGEQIATDVGPGGRLENAVISEADSNSGIEDDPLNGGDSLAAGVRYEPALTSDPAALIATAGGFVDGPWNEFRTSRFATKTDGTWVLNHYLVENIVALQFMGRNYSGFAEVFKDDIATVRVAAKGLNLAVEVVDCNGQVITAVGPKKRLRNLFMQLGHAL